jgi:outer membrane immunogenic protein
MQTRDNGSTVANWIKAATLGVALAGASGVAQAADLYSPREPAPTLRAFDSTPWTGGYVGLSLGRSWGTTKFETSTGNATIDTNGGQIAGYAGYTWQSGIFVFGGEAELSTGTLKGTSAAGDFSQDMKWMGAVRARAGVLVAQPLYVYGMAGVAWSDMAFKANGFDRDQSFAGLQLGAGAEYRFSQNWALRLDYIYTGFGNERRDFPGTSRHVDPDFSTVRAGLSFRF